MSTPAQDTRTRPRPGDELVLDVDGLAFGGAGVARADGYVVFVDGAVPGDRVRAHVYKAKRAYGHARAVEVLEASAQRIEPAADHPGAPWQVLPYERQLAVKSEQVGDALRRIGRLEGLELEPIVAAEQPWRYRNKVEFSFGTGVEGELVCGFHAPGRWNDIVPMTDCKLVSERVNELREEVLAFCKGYMAWDRRDQRGFLRNLVVREGGRRGQPQVRLVPPPGKLDVDGFIDAVDTDGLW